MFVNGRLHRFDKKTRALVAKHKRTTIQEILNLLLLQINCELSVFFVPTRTYAEFILDRKRVFFYRFVACPFFEYTVHSLQFNAHDLKKRTCDKAIKNTCDRV